MPLVDQGGCEHRQEPARHKQEGLAYLSSSVYMV